MKKGSSKAADELRPEYKRSDFDALVRAEYAQRIRARRPRGAGYSLRGLLRKVASRNLHEEVGTDVSVGREAW